MADATTALTAQQLAQLNIAARGAVLSASVAMRQQIYSVGYVPSSQNIYNIPVNNVGLIRGFFVKVVGTIQNTAAGALSLTNFGAANVLSSIVFTDLNNQVRIQTTGWHLFMVNSAKQPMVMGGAYMPNVPVGFGNNFTVQSAPATIAASASATVTFYYYVPLSYTAQDLRGAMYAGVVNATSTLQVTVNPTPCVATGADATLALYTGNNAAGWKAGTNVTVTVWQDYLDQLPTAQNGSVILPPLDLQTIYELKNVALSGLVQGQDFGVPFANMRTFLSACLVFDNGGQLNAGSDVNYFALRSANTLAIFQNGPNEQALLARSIFMADPPAGVYWFDFRAYPINTAQFGNMNLFINPILVNANAALLIGFEDFATTSQIQYAATLPNG